MTLFLVADMSNLIVFKVYYSTIEVHHDPYGVDFSSFPVTFLDIENPEGYRMKQMICFNPMVPVRHGEVLSEGRIIAYEAIEFENLGISTRQNNNGVDNWLRWCRYQR